MQSRVAKKINELDQVFMSSKNDCTNMNEKAFLEKGEHLDFEDEWFDEYQKADEADGISKRSTMDGYEFGQKQECDESEGY